MVEQVKIFAACPKDFIRALVIKLQPGICVSGDYIFCAGEAGDKMYFMKRGSAQCLIGETVVASFKEGDYFGEIALLSSKTRTADIRAVTDCMLLSLNKNDFTQVRGRPAAHPRQR